MIGIPHVGTEGTKGYVDSNPFERLVNYQPSHLFTSILHVTTCDDTLAPHLSAPPLKRSAVLRENLTVVFKLW